VYLKIKENKSRKQNFEAVKNQQHAHENGKGAGSLKSTPCHERHEEKLLKTAIH
jgi:hypothetical protein